MNQSPALLSDAVVGDSRDSIDTSAYNGQHNSQNEETLMADDFLYISRNRLEMNRGLRHAYTGDVPAPVVYGVQGALKSHYGVPEDAPPIASTLDHIVSAVGG